MVTPWKPWRPWRRPPGMNLHDYMITSTRWHIAGALNRLPGQCWADLVSWVLRDNADDPIGWRHWNAWSPVREHCVGGWITREGDPPPDACYCGKVCPLSSDRVFTKAGGVR